MPHDSRDTPDRPTPLDRRVIRACAGVLRRRYPGTDWVFVPRDKSEAARRALPTPEEIAAAVAAAASVAQSGPIGQGQATAEEATDG